MDSTIWQILSSKSQVLTLFTSTYTIGCCFTLIEICVHTAQVFALGFDWYVKKSYYKRKSSLVDLSS